MPVDLAKDRDRLAETVAWVPGLKIAWILATEIIDGALVFLLSPRH